MCSGAVPAPAEFAEIRAVGVVWKAGEPSHYNSKIEIDPFPTNFLKFWFSHSCQAATLTSPMSEMVSPK